MEFDDMVILIDKNLISNELILSGLPNFKVWFIAR